MIARMAALCAAACVASAQTPAPRMGLPAVNFAHLEHLIERIRLAGDSVEIVHVYANYPDYRWVSAAESGPEGIACVDDAARAAVLFMRDWELHGDRASLLHARGLLAFVAAMQAPDGEMYNFVLPDHTINRDGKTSFKSFGWWAARGLAAMAKGAGVFASSDPAFARAMRKRVEKMVPHAEALMARYGECASVKGYRVPRWLLYGSGADVTSEMLLGLLEFRKTTRDSALTRAIRGLMDGLRIMQDGDERTSPYGLHRSWETAWHMWGNAETQALAAGGLLLGDTAALASAAREAGGWYGRLLTDGFLSEWDLASDAPPKRFTQIAYGVRPMALGLLNLYEATHREDYLVMAGLAASWLTGNNAAHRAMYDPAAGRCLDGIRDASTLNMNSGAESTIEALATLIEIERYPGAAKYLRCRNVASGSSDGVAWALFRSPDGAEATLARAVDTGRLAVYEGEQSRAFCRKEGIP
ncbi:MAG TPA: hypothetical protein VL221_13615 [Bacteroidota bacterium]|nr:hypothetical protein [Bacteroidota bacterium]